VNPTQERKKTGERLRVMGFLEDHGIISFEYHPQTMVDIFEPYFDVILRLYGPEAEDIFLTDESIIFDVCGDFFGEEPCDVTPIEKLGVDVTEHDFVWEVAARLKKLSE